jgi:hypothetical protein
MTLEEAKKLVSQLGTDIGAEPGAFLMNDQGVASLVYDDRSEVIIKHFENCMIIGCIVAEEIGQADPGVFPTLMDYQYLGIRTFGNVLSWNSDGSSLILSRHVFGEPSDVKLRFELERLLEAAEIVKDDLETILDGNWKDAASLEENEEPAPALPSFLDRA